MIPGLEFALGWISGTIFTYCIMLAIHMRMKPKGPLYTCTKDQDCPVHLGDCSLPAWWRR